MIFENNEHIVFAGDSVTDMNKEQFENMGRGYVRVVDKIDISVTTYENTGTSTVRKKKIK